MLLLSNDRSGITIGLKSDLRPIKGRKQQKVLAKRHKTVKIRILGKFLLPDNPKHAILFVGVKYTRFLILNFVSRFGMDSKEEKSGGKKQI